MIAGLPGTGISGLFYILSAFWMPVAETVRLLRGRERQSNWKLVFSQFALASGILLILGVTGAMLDYFISFSAKIMETVASTTDNQSQLVNLGVAPTIITIVVLFGFLFSIEIVGMILGRIKSHNPHQIENKSLIVNNLFSKKQKAVEKMRG
jgi:Sec-independent protein secretion pathway component TatC